MSTTLETLGINKMSIDDRIALIEEIWDSVVAEQEQTPLTEAQKTELDRRLAAYEENPANVIPWEQIKAKALARFSK
jgi:putative addiction module component (TIGR02574 family)